MPSTTASTKPVWVINKDDKENWVEEHSTDTQLKKKFDNFEKTIIADPVRSAGVKKLKGELKDIYEYFKVKPVRGLYTLNHSAAEIHIVQFDWKGNIKYKLK